MIEIRQLSKSYGPQPALRNVCFRIKTAAVTGIAGPNACGKTTLMKCILGLTLKDRGEVLMNGKAVDPAGDFRNLIGYMPQDAGYPKNLTVRELLHMLEDLRGIPAPRKDELISFFALEPFLEKPVGRLSGGTRQKVAAVVAFMFDSPIVLLDEPTSGMDPIVSLRFKSLVKKEAEAGKAVVLVSHLMTEVEQLATEIVFLCEGEVVFSGAISSLLETTEAVGLEAALTRLFERRTEARP